MVKPKAAQSQRDVLSAIFILGENTRGFDPKAVAAYRNNLHASAIRALQISYPTILQLCGEAFFQSLALLYLQQRPFKEGDWGEWGEDFPSFIARAAEAKSYPYFSAVAELDWRVHQAERAGDESVDGSSFALLSAPGAEQCKLRLSPIVTILPSDYPIVDIFRAHYVSDSGVGEAEEKRRLLSEAKQKMNQQCGQTAIVYRPLFKAYVEALEPHEVFLLKGMLEGLTLSKLIVGLGDLVAEPENFDFESWLASCVEKKIILGVNP